MAEKSPQTPYYNCHAHIFLNADVPRRFLPGGLIRWLGRPRLTRGLARLLHRLNPGSQDDVFDRWANMLYTDSLGSQAAVLENMQRFYPRDTVFAALSMDMEYMGAGTLRRPFNEQLAELAALKRREGSRLLAFIAVDPRRPGIYEMVRRYIEEHDFTGIKLYPALGYYPYDARLEEIYAYAQAHSIPVISHGTRSGAVYFRGSRRELIRLVRDEVHAQVPVKGFNNRRLCDYFSHPMNYEPVLERFPGLKLDIAHWGGTSEWQDYLYNPSKDREISYLSNWFRIIKHMMRRYPRLYTDISYTLGHIDHLPLLDILLEDTSLRERVLFGSDYYLVNAESSERTFSLDIRSRLGEEKFNLIARHNPERFFARW